MTALSLNLTQGTSRQLSDDEVAAYSAPLFVTGGMACMEVVFWSAAFGLWVVLVRDHTQRLFPPGGSAREVTPDELPYYESWLRSQQR